MPHLSDEALLQSLEEALSEPAVRSDPARLCELLDEDFREFGSSGRIFSREEILKELSSEQPVSISLTAFQVQWIAPDYALVTYQAAIRRDAEDVHSLRSSLWRNREGRWRLFFHQGTRIAPGTVART